MWLLIIYTAAGIFQPVAYDTYKECIDVAHKLTVMEARTTLFEVRKEKRRIACVEIFPRMAP